MADALFPDEAFVEITLIDGEAINVTTDIDSFEESGFEREIEYRKFFGNAQVKIKKQQSEGELSVNAKVTRALWDQMLWGGTGSDFTSGGEQQEYRVTFLVTKDPSASTASGSVTNGYDSYRKVYAGCSLTSFTPTLEIDGMLEGEATFAISPVDETGDPNVRIQQGDGGFSALSSYATGTKW